jgi:hypothetical protein
MKNTNRSPVSALLAVAAMVGLGGCYASENVGAKGAFNRSEEPADGHKVVSVSASDIPDKVKIIGIFGRPLGELLTIRGKWVAPGLRKDGNLRFQVIDVDGRPSKDEVELLHWGTILQVHPGRKGRGPNPGDKWDWKYDFNGSMSSPLPTDGETWEMLCVEVGCFDFCYSEDAERELQSNLQQRPSYARPFFTRFEYITVKIVK